MTDADADIAPALSAMVWERKELAKRLRFFDAGLWLGPPGEFPLAEEMKSDELLAAAGRAGITGGLVSHWLGKTVSAQDGNRCLVESVSVFPKDWHCIWTGLPLFPGEPGPLPGSDPVFVRVKGIRLFPKSHKFLLADFVVGSLLDFMTQVRLPLFVWHTELDWASLDEIAGKFPKLTVIVETQTQKILYHMRTLLPLMRERPNVLLDTSNLSGQDYLEYGVKTLGPERFIFGSFLPVFDPLAPIGAILDARISEDDKRLIAGDNLRRIVGEVRL